ncbi:MAG TPA: response regulator [Gallionella sp.]|nr:response regulator [Gallionella sp.]
MVDDDRRIVKTTCDILKLKGYESVAAYTGEEALEAVKSAVPDCVLMDIKMPGISGVEAMKKIHETDPAVPVVLISAYATEEVMADARQAGAYAVMNKPMNFQLILSLFSLLRKEESILVVDNDPVFCKTLREILALRGYRVETENTPQKVLDDLEKSYKLVIVLDLRLDDVNGLAVLRQVRAKYPSKPVVLVTGYRHEMSESIEKGLEIGAYTVLYKPFETEELVGLLENIRRMKLQNVLIST